MYIILFVDLRCVSSVVIGLLDEWASVCGCWCVAGRQTGEVGWMAASGVVPAGLKV